MKQHLYVLAVVCLSLSCYNQKAAQKQFSKAAVTYPIIPAQYCASVFPPKTTIIKGDTITKTDTVQLEGSVVTDTLISLDTIRITIVRTLPGQTITKTINVTDTITIENTAQLKVCELERSNTLDLLADANQKLTVSQKRAKTRGIVMWSLIALAVILAAWKIYGIFKPKVK
jgi:hypothetical protein